MKTALVIEDNENNRELITFILQIAGYRAICAADGLTGYEMAVREQPDFIILDIQLPDVDGTEVLRMIRRNPDSRHIPAIAVTSYAMSGDRERLLGAGCNGYIEKPIDPDTVIEHIRTILGERDEDTGGG
jgi:two-component system, cell cycle response regulator DivK